MPPSTDFTYAKRALRGLAPYVPGEQPPPDPTLIKLNTNENPYPPSPRVAEALASMDAARLAMYPDPAMKALRQAAAELLGMPVEWVIAGNGSDELLAMALRAFVDPDAVVAYPVPTYSLYRTLARMTGATVVERPAPIGEPKIDAVLDLPAALTFIAAPNSPDGFLTTPEDVARLCAARRGVGVVVVDEAYVDFSAGGCLSLLEHCDNLLITRTLSKSFSLAGLRVGIAMAGPALMPALWTVKDSYNVGELPQRLAVAALRDAEHMRANAARIVHTRETFAAALRARGWRVYPSAANFLFAEPPAARAAELYRALAERRIFVRYFSEPPLDRGLRISIGTDEQMRCLLQALDTLGNL